MRKFTRGHITDFLKKYASDASTLDIGAGGNDHKELFPNRVTLDIDPARNPDIVGDAHALPFGAAHFEVVVCSEVFEHLQNPPQAVGEMWRVLKPGGLLVLTTRFIFPVHDAPGDYWRFTPYGLRLLFSQWEILEIEAEADPFGTIAVLLQRIMFQTTLRGGKATKALLYVLALFFNTLSPLLKVQYGDIKRGSKVDILLTSGLFIACRKPL
ncbi:MAG TPA: class I SAM-dependent methyltransferase [Candidatus Paceibacterota bacterium]